MRNVSAPNGQPLPRDDLMVARTGQHCDCPHPLPFRITSKNIVTITTPDDDLSYEEIKSFDDYVYSSIPSFFTRVKPTINKEGRTLRITGNYG